jgi:hypothetical protein
VPYGAPVAAPGVAAVPVPMPAEPTPVTVPAPESTPPPVNPLDVNLNNASSTIGEINYTGSQTITENTGVKTPASLTPQQEGRVVDIIQTLITESVVDLSYEYSLNKLFPSPTQPTIDMAISTALADMKMPRNQNMLDRLRDAMLNTYKLGSFYSTIRKLPVANRLLYEYIYNKYTVSNGAADLLILLARNMLNDAEVVELFEEMQLVYSPEKYIESTSQFLFQPTTGAEIKEQDTFLSRTQPIREPKLATFLRQDINKLKSMTETPEKKLRAFSEILDKAFSRMEKYPENLLGLPVHKLIYAIYYDNGMPANEFVKEVMPFIDILRASHKYPSLSHVPYFQKKVGESTLPRIPQ